jgi:signal transduction histidine kinase
MKFAFQTRIVLVFFGLYLSIQAVTLLMAYRIAHHSVQRQLLDTLNYAEHSFEQVMMNRSEQIADEARLLVADYALRSTLTGGDAETIRSALMNLNLRIHGQRAVFIGLDGKTLADTVDNAATPPLPDQWRSSKPLVTLSYELNRLQEWAFVPVLAPLPVGWVGIALDLDQSRIEQIKRLSSSMLEISLIKLSPEEAQLLISSLNTDQQADLQQRLQQPHAQTWLQQQVIALDDHDWLSRQHAMPTAAGQVFVALLQIDLSLALKPYWHLFYATLVISLFGLVMALLGCWLLAQRLSKPVRELADASRSFADGNFKTPEHLADDELGQLAKTFQRAAQLAGEMNQLKQQDQLRRELVAAVSHDLRSPLTTLHGFLQILQQENRTQATSEQQTYLDTALRQSETLGRMAQDLFELARLECEEQPLHTEAFYVSDMVYDVLGKYQLSARQKNIRIDVQLAAALPMAWGDIALIERVLANLIDNALRHTQEYGTIRIAAEYLQQKIRLSVGDNGCGIAAEYLPQLFDYASPLAQQRKRQGRGFGLLAVAKILQLHGSRIEVESELEQGSVFRFELSIAE